MLYIYPAYTTENIFTLIADHFGVGPGREIGPLCVSVRMIPFELEPDDFSPIFVSFWFID